VNIIKKMVPVTELLAGLAEEAAELAQAALKYRRVLDGVNPTPTDEDTAYENLCEEIADVKLYASMLSLNARYISEIMDKKLKRWEGRLNKNEQTIR
jgi:NTP pyrophosphatase (non-canonical NTP hydrolase)